MKYTKKDLKKKALFLLKLKSKGNFRYTEFCIRMMGATGETMDFIERQILTLARG